MADNLSKFPEDKRKQMEGWIAGWKKYIDDDLASIKKATGKEFKLDPNFASLPNLDDYTYAKTYGYDIQNGLTPKICHLKPADLKTLVAAASSGVIKLVYGTKKQPGSVSFENGVMLVTIDPEGSVNSQNCGFDLEKALTAWSLSKPSQASSTGAGSDINPVTALKTALGFIDGIDADPALLKQVVSRPGFPINTHFDDDGNTALHSLMVQYRSKRDENLKILIDAGADCNAVNKLGSTPLDIAASHSSAYYSNGWCDYNADIIGTLISLCKSKLNPNLVNNRGNTPLLTALLSQRFLQAEAILKNCKNINIDFKNSYGDDALSVAVKAGATYITELIENYTPESNLSNNNKPLNSGAAKQPLASNAKKPNMASAMADPDVVSLITLMADIMANDMEDRGFTDFNELRTRSYALKKKYNMK